MSLSCEAANDFCLSLFPEY
uniref:Uncharacterized protein n=1 Tax=Arundo donax TaxID=35708 RepID=A0A0A9A9J1_ARUDO